MKDGTLLRSTAHLFKGEPGDFFSGLLGEMTMRSYSAAILYACA